MEVNQKGLVIMSMKCGSEDKIKWLDGSRVKESDNEAHVCLDETDEFLKRR